MTISPPAAQLENRKAGDNLLLSCAVDNADDETLVTINWFKDTDRNVPIPNIGRYVCVCLLHLHSVTESKVLPKPKLLSLNFYLSLIVSLSLNLNPTSS